MIKSKIRYWSESSTRYRRVSLTVIHARRPVCPRRQHEHEAISSVQAVLRVPRVASVETIAPSMVVVV